MPAVSPPATASSDSNPVWRSISAAARSILAANRSGLTIEEIIEQNSNIWWQRCFKGMSRPANSSSLLALRDQIRHIEQPARHGVLPFGVVALDDALPGGGLALGAVHEITGAGGDEEDGAAAAGFAAGILARLDTGSLRSPPVLCPLPSPP